MATTTKTKTMTTTAALRLPPSVAVSGPLSWCSSWPSCVHGGNAVGSIDDDVLTSMRRSSENPLDEEQAVQRSNSNGLSGPPKLKKAQSGGVVNANNEDQIRSFLEGCGLVQYLDALVHGYRVSTLEELLDNENLDDYELADYIGMSDDEIEVFRRASEVMKLNALVHDANAAVRVFT